MRGQGSDNRHRVECVAVNEAWRIQVAVSGSTRELGGLLLHRSDSIPGSCAKQIPIVLIIHSTS